MPRRTMNWELIASDLADARHEIDDILANLGHPDMSVRRFKVMLEHILFHLLFAWNARHLPYERYGSLSVEEFDRYCRMPNDLHPLGIGTQAPATVRRSGKFDRQWGRPHRERHWTRSEREFTWWKRKRRKQ